jgi:hypothetical protein
MTVKIPGGNKNNSMYFVDAKPQIKDNRGQILPWITRGEQVIYVTNSSVTIRGTWLGECSVKLEKIE